MNKDVKNFLNLLKSSLYTTGDKGIASKDIDWGIIYNISKIHKTVPMIYEAAIKTDGFKNTDDNLNQYWRNDTLTITINQVIKSEKFVKLYEEFNKANISVLVFKGIICRQLYPNPDQRISSDEDILVSKEDFEKCEAIILSNGLVKTEEAYDEDVNSYLCPNTGLYLEVHNNLFNKNSKVYEGMCKLFDDVFEDKEKICINGVNVYTFSLDKHFMYLICHTLKHFIVSGVGIRQICDLVMYINEYGQKIDWEYIWKSAEDIGYDTLLVNILQIGVEHLELHKNLIRYKKDISEYFIDIDDLIEEIIDAGIYGNSSLNRKNTAIMSLEAVAGETTSKKSNLKAIFPKVNMIKGRYEYLNKYPMLLPIAWGQRIFDYVGEKGSVKEVKMAADETIDIGNKRIALLKKYGVI